MELAHERVQGMGRRLEQWATDHLRGVNSRYSLDAALLLPGVGGSGYCPAHHGGYTDPHMVPYVYRYSNEGDHSYASLYAYLDPYPGVYAYPILADRSPDGYWNTYTNGHRNADRYPDVHRHTDGDIHAHSHCHCYPYADAYTHGNQYPDRHAHSDCDWNGHGHSTRDSHFYSHAYPD